MGFIEILTIFSLITSILAGFITIVSYIPFVRKFINENEKAIFLKKIVPILKTLFIIWGILSVVLIATGNLNFSIGKDSSELVYSLTDPQCLSDPSQEKTLSFEWIVDSEEEFDARISYFTIPYSSGVTGVMAFSDNWVDVKIVKGKKTFKNIINYSDTKRGRYKICASLINKVGESELENNCCTITLNSDIS